MVNVVQTRSRMEFTDYCRFARRIDTLELRSQLQELSTSENPVVRTQAAKMLFFCEHGRWPNKGGDVMPLANPHDPESARVNGPR